jgi:hypothetical protein
VTGADALRILAKPIFGDPQHTHALQVLELCSQTPVLSWSSGEDTGMAQIVVKNLKLDCIPQAAPGA